MHMQKGKSFSVSTFFLFKILANLNRKIVKIIKTSSKLICQHITIKTMFFEVKLSYHHCPSKVQVFSIVEPLFG